MSVACRSRVNQVFDQYIDRGTLKDTWSNKGTCRCVSNMFFCKEGLCLLIYKGLNDYSCLIIVAHNLLAYWVKFKKKSEKLLIPGY